MINTMLVRADVSGSPSLRQLLNRNRERFIADLANAAIPFERIARRLKASDGGSLVPHVWFQFRNLPHQPIADHGRLWEIRQPFAGIAPRELVLEICPEFDGWSVRWTWSVAKYDRAQIARWSTQLLEVMAEANDSSARLEAQ